MELTIDKETGGHSIENDLPDVKARRILLVDRRLYCLGVDKQEEEPDDDGKSLGQ